MTRLGMTVALAALLIAGAFGIGRAEGTAIRVRWCPEDAVHVGVGDFNGSRYEAYRCVPRDDIKPGGFTAAIGR